MNQETTQADTSIVDYMLPEDLQLNNNSSNFIDLNADLLMAQPALQIREAELELIDPDLRNSNQPAELFTKKFNDFYDSAPIGYLILSKEGRIKEINLMGTSILSKKRQHLINTFFGFFVSIESKAIFNLYLSRIFGDNAEQACEMVLNTDGLVPVHVRVTSMVSTEKDKCMVTLTDINERLPLNHRLEERNSEFLQSGSPHQPPASDIAVLRKRLSPKLKI